MAGKILKPGSVTFGSALEDEKPNEVNVFNYVLQNVRSLRNPQKNRDGHEQNLDLSNCECWTLVGGRVIWMQLSCAKIFRSCHMKVRKLMHQIGLLYHLYYLEEGTFCPFRTFSGGRHFLLPFRTHWSKTVIDKERMVKNVTKLPWSKSITAVGHKMTF